MIVKRIIHILLLLSLTHIGIGQTNGSINTYVDCYKDIAMIEMKRTGVPAAITLAQGILESSIGRSKLVITANNHFGIKCKSDWTGEVTKHTDDSRNECFRKYSSAIESYIDHSNFLRSRPWYQFLFKIDPTNYKEWAWGLRKAGYATDKNYAYSLIRLIEKYNLNKYSLLALNYYSQFLDNEDMANAYSTTY